MGLVCILDPSIKSPCLSFLPLLLSILIQWEDSDRKWIGLGKKEEDLIHLGNFIQGSVLVMHFLEQGELDIWAVGRHACQTIVLILPCLHIFNAMHPLPLSFASSPPLSPPLLSSIQGMRATLHSGMGMT